MRQWPAPAGSKTRHPALRRDRWSRLCWAASVQPIFRLGGEGAGSFAVNTGGEADGGKVVGADAGGGAVVGDAVTGVVAGGALTGGALTGGVLHRVAQRSAASWRVCSSAAERQQAGYSLAAAQRPALSLGILSEDYAPPANCLDRRGRRLLRPREIPRAGFRRRQRERLFPAARRIQRSRAHTRDRIAVGRNRGRGELPFLQRTRKWRLCAAGSRAALDRALRNQIMLRAHPNLPTTGRFPDREGRNSSLYGGVPALRKSTRSTRNVRGHHAGFRCPPRSIGGPLPKGTA